MTMQRSRILIGALACHAFAERREACLATWANAVPDNVDVVFLLGNAETAVPQRNGNLLFCPCADDYPSLPQKTRWFCRWAVANCAFDYLFKCDDDTYIAMDRIANGAWSGDFIGHDLGEFASGGAGYLLSRRAASVVAETLVETTGPEDVYTAHVLRRAGIRLSAEPRFFPWDTSWPTPQNDLITGHHCKPERMLAIHREMMGGSVGDADSFALSRGTDA
jgi:hypothetical protein